jgi:hypothetical protein
LADPPQGERPFFPRYLFVSTALWADVRMYFSLNANIKREQSVVEKEKIIIKEKQRIIEKKQSIKKKE